ncbi:MAG: DUF433 domain-containing protein [Candidatus Binataceae bacterium]
MTPSERLREESYLLDMQRIKTNSRFLEIPEHLRTLCLNATAKSLERTHRQKSVLGMNENWRHRMIVGSVADGDTPEQIIDAWPQLNGDDVRATLKFAAEAVSNADFVPLHHNRG